MANLEDLKDQAYEARAEFLTQLSSFLRDAESLETALDPAKPDSVKDLLDDFTQVELDWGSLHSEFQFLEEAYHKFYDAIQDYEDAEACED